MSLESLKNGGALLIDPRIGFPVPNTIGSTITLTSINNTGESQTAIGHIILEGGATSGSKTISSAGGKIHWVETGGSTFDDPASNLRIGLQDVEATGLEDGTFDVYADLVGGTDLLSGGGVVTTAMETGSKTLNHGDLIAVSFELTAFGGADGISLHGAPNFKNLPYRTQDTGAGPAKNATNSIPLFTIEFDDGTMGWFIGGYATFHSNLAMSQLSDEAALVFKMPVSCEVNYVHIPIGAILATDTFDIVIFKDPTTSPVVLQTISVNPNKLGSPTSTGTLSIPISPLKVSANRFYGIAVKSTSAGFISTSLYDFGGGNSYLRKATILQENWGYGHRTAGSTGAFTYDEEKLFVVGFEISKIHSGTVINVF